MYNNKTFADIWNSASSFVTDVQSSFASTKISQEKATELFYLLYSEYGNSPISNSDENQFKYKVYSTIYKYAPAWEKKLEIQEVLRNLNEDDITLGNKVVSNSANNPDGLPTCDGLEELISVQAQSSSTSKRGKLEAYAMLYGLIQTDITGEFISMFKSCFRQFAMPDAIDLFEEV